MCKNCHMALPRSLNEEAKGRFYYAQTMKYCFFYIIGLSLIMSVLFLMLCVYSSQCSWKQIKELSVQRGYFITSKNYTSVSRSREFGDLTTQSCEPLHPRVVFYNRIFKSASSTMSSFFKKCSKRLGYIFTKDFTEEWENENISHPILTRIQAQIARSKKLNKKLMAVAHLYFREDIDSAYINLLREPVARFISHYYYCRSPNRYAHKLKRLKELGHFNVTIEKCLEKQYEGCVWNHMTRFFCGPQAFCKSGSDEALAAAKHNMLHYYASVGIMEYINEFVMVLHKRLPDFVLPPPRDGMRKKKVTKGVTKNGISESTRSMIINANRADIQLYEFAKDLLFKQALNCGIKIVT
ncbi:heparan sulfate 2-O-sulfotransferase hst-2-like isoform X1 [Dendronephthya gigantea]|uniref:heparan sulfate 2-O-sulfotransferase hst-2-like isoform X1 n=2 Tax=Dendronephthya gigantea TaxID=151771 RepID=UPI00106BD1A3|nr:heparan sulfate 2-O-sulfotransferase hst-2-like isoform X1 [Dendronephthya gigantea]